MPIDRPDRSLDRTKQMKDKNFLSGSIHLPCSIKHALFRLVLLLDQRGSHRAA
jgi:hypothetical protein